MIALKSIPQKLGYVVGAQWARDLAWAAFTILLARHSPDALGQIMLSLSFGYLVRMIADAGLNDFLLSSFARSSSRGRMGRMGGTGSSAQHVSPRTLLGEITWIKSVLLCLVMGAAWLITGWQGYSHELRITVMAISFGLGLDAVTDSFFALCQARGRQDVEMRIRVPSSLLGLGFGICMVLLEVSPMYIALYKPAESLVLIAFALKALGRNPLSGIRWAHMRQLAEQWKHGIVFTCMTCCAMTYNKINVFFLKKYDTDAAVGAYSIAWETVEGLSMLVSSALLGKVIFPMLTRLWEEDKEAFRRLAGQTARSLWAVALPAIYILFVESDRILSLIYGPAYASAVTVQRILTPCLATAFLHNLAAYAMIGMRKHRLLLAFYASGLVLNLILCFVLIPRMPFEGTAITLTATKVWVAILTISYFQRHASPMNLAQWGMMLLAIALSAGLWLGLSPYLFREAAEAAGLVPLLALLWKWRPPAPWETKENTG